MAKKRTPQPHPTCPALLEPTPLDPPAGEPGGERNLERAGEKAAPASTPSERGRMARRLLAVGRTAAEVVDALVKSYDLTPAAARRELQQARRMQVAEIERSRRELRAEAYEVYRAVIRDPDASPADRLRAQERIDRLLGILSDGEATPEETVRGPDLRIVLSGLHDDELAALDRLRERIEQSAGRPAAGGPVAGGAD